MRTLHLLSKSAVVIVGLTAALSLCSQAQTTQSSARTNVPQPVLDAFKKSYPHAVIKGTGKETEEGKTYYEIESIDGKAKRDVLYLPDGTVAEVEEEIAVSALPDAVKQSVSKESAHGRIMKAEKLTKNGEISYEVIAKKGAKSLEIVLKTDGSVVKKELRGAKNKEEKEEEGKEEDEH
ncbi:MAG: hypothetical protein ACM3Q4_00185 [Acidobacteriota bacterium]